MIQEQITDMFSQRALRAREISTLPTKTLAALANPDFHTFFPCITFIEDGTVGSRERNLLIPAETLLLGFRASAVTAGGLGAGFEFRLTLGGNVPIITGYAIASLFTGTSAGGHIFHFPKPIHLRRNDIITIGISVGAFPPLPAGNRYYVTFTALSNIRGTLQ